MVNLENMMTRQATPAEIELVWACGYSGRDDTPPASKTKAIGDNITDRKILDQAIAVVRAAGLAVSKPRSKRGKNNKRKNGVGPTFAATFSDGTQTRMTTFTSLDKLDWDRGIRLAQAAWQSRWRTRKRASRPQWQAHWKTGEDIAPVPPAIVAAHFEHGGKIVAQREFQEVVHVTS
jgi:hypothetical protein